MSRTAKTKTKMISIDLSAFVGKSITQNGFAPDVIESAEISSALGSGVIALNIQGESWEYTVPLATAFQIAGSRVHYAPNESLSVVRDGRAFHILFEIGGEARSLNIQ